MNENEPNQSVPPNTGYENEASQADTFQALPAPESSRNRRRGDKAAELKANFNSVFGHGIGKAALIIATLVILVGVGLGVRGLSKSDKGQAGQGGVDIPTAPAPKVTIDPIDQKEAERRAERAAIEADEARQRGQTYQPDFNPAVVTQGGGTGQTQPGIRPGLHVDGQTPPTEGQSNVQQPAVQIAVPAGQANNAAEEQRREAEAARQRAEMQKAVDQVRTGVKEQVSELLGSNGKDGGLRGAGSYSSVTYLPAQRPATSGNNGVGTPQNANGITSTSNDLQPQNRSGADSNTTGNSKKKVVFKAGKAIFATLDSEVNTDDGGEVFATVRGGTYDGAKLIGKIEQAPRNIRLKFSLLSPQDERPTLNINAIAIREQDAKQGMADSVDNHTLERYSALFAGSVLSGIGKAASQPQGTVIILPNGQTVSQQDEVTNRRLAMYALGEIGTNAGAEVRQSFSQPPTYKTAANRGIGIVFLTDVNEQ